MVLKELYRDTWNYSQVMIHDVYVGKSHRKSKTQENIFVNPSFVLVKKNTPVNKQ